jgi:hypothetical protein
MTMQHDETETANSAQTSKAEIPRFVPDALFPPYSYVTGRFPHPTRDPAGHSFGEELAKCPAPDPNCWRDCRAYLFGLDLFNHGYYWEAHETWEGIWHACGRRGTAANFVKGLIKLAAAGVKAREGRPKGIVSHARRAAELFRQTADNLRSSETFYFGFSLPRLIDLANGVANGSVPLRAITKGPVEIVFPFVLQPDQWQLPESKG